jgi:hypothetical protein
MPWLPTLKEEILNVAWPPDKLFVPKVVEFSLKITVPIGVAFAALTVAVNWISWPGSDGFGEDVKLTEVAAALTVNVPFVRLNT